MKHSVYLDYNATAPMRAEVAMLLAEKMQTLTGNPSSVHGYGRVARKELETAREQVAKLIGTNPINVVFTSGATEANNAVINGAPVTRILYSAIEHPSVIDAALHKGNAFSIPVLSNGVIDLDALEKLLQNDVQPTLICVMWVNNETGVIQPVAEIKRLAIQYGALFHCDAVQAAGRVPIEMDALGIDYLTVSAHKIGGPSGIGALVYNHETILQKFIHGGGQERRRRAGTENLFGALGFGLAAELASKEANHLSQLQQWRDHCETEMHRAMPTVEFIGKEASRVPNTIQMVLPGATAETQLMALDLDGIAVSSGAACSSGSIKPSHVLLAMGVSEAKAKCAIRVSMGFRTTQKDIDYFLERWVINSQRLIKD
jgi:cysteine desulfurase